eukprot:NODE_3058_length_948_cov_254.476248_g3038_i0.p1 GENE.NODE_3058_length_948_cov_254.476248_g3038_i0~~NODE_3058_length_948_cov_254.476248_g3038_i0.p1  ORF type:complete len:259 (+),score=40.15 NODE_3058_length_948_cov_254.476248_g3038_i0:73-849(+)
MGKTIASQRRGAGSVYTAHTHKRIAPMRLNPIDYNHRNGYSKGIIKAIRHEPGRGAPIAEVQFRHPYKYKRVTSYMVAPEGCYTGQFVYHGRKAQLSIGNVLPLKQMPEGTVICNIEAKLGDRSVLAKAGGAYGILIQNNPDTNRTRIKLPSGQKKSISSDCRAMVGVVAGGGRIEKPLLKAGNSYWRYKMKRNCWPKVRGVARNPVEHPHGGGNHQHIGHPSTVRGDCPPGQKVGLIMARRTGRLRGKGKVLAKRDS